MYMIVNVHSVRKSTEEVEHDSDILRRFVVFLFFVREHWHLHLCADLPTAS